MPMIRFRVVWGLGVTMEIFCPSKAFSSVDLPALGGPTIATIPDLIVFSCITIYKILILLRSHVLLADPFINSFTTYVSCEGYILFISPEREKVPGFNYLSRIDYIEIFPEVVIHGFTLP
jgi:hypothetical protein